MLVRKVLCLFLLLTAAVTSAENVFELLNPNAQQALKKAQEKARELGAARVGQSHLLWALLQESEQPEIARMLRQAGGINLELLNAAVEKIMLAQPKGAAGAVPPLGDDVASFIRNQCRQAHTDLAEVKIPSEALLISLVDSGNSELRKATSEVQMTKNELRDAALLARGRLVGQPKPSHERTALQEFGVDLTETARRKGFRPIVGSSQEVKGIQREFLGGDGTGVALVGRSGVGKTRVLEELARLTALPVEQQPEQFRNKRLVVIDVASITAGASHHGEAEGRIKAIIDDAKRPVNGVETILVLDNIKPPEKDKASTADFGTTLARELKNLPGVILTCEEDVWHNYILRNTDLGRTVSFLHMVEPDKASAFQMLKKEHIPALERKYGVKIDDVALHAAQDLAKRFFGDKPEPKRTLMLLENTCKTYRYGVNERTPPTDAIDEKIKWVHYEMSRWASKSNSSLSGPKLEKLREELAGLEDKKAALEQRFQHGLDIKFKADRISDYIEQLEAFLKFADRERNVTPPVDRAHIEQLLKSNREELARVQEALSIYQKDFSTLSPVISDRHVAEVVSREKKVPLGHMIGNVEDRLRQFDDFIKERLIGQETAVQALRNAVYKYFTELRDPNRPYVVRFKGPTGVGKTELAKLLNEFLFGSKEEVFTLNMTEYTEKHTVSQLFGSPVGYEGHYEGGKLTNHVMKNPFTVVMIDEAEKAHPGVLTAFLRPFDEGKGSDTVGRRIDYSNVIFVQTDNCTDDAKCFRPEYLNRIQDTIEFKPLTREQLLEVFEIKFKPIYERILDKLSIKVVISDEMKLQLVKEAQSTYGARQIQNVIESYIVSPIAYNYVHQEFQVGDEVTFTMVKKGTASKPGDSDYDFEATVTGNTASCGGALDAAGGE